MRKCLYSVWRNEPGNDEVIAIDETAQKCAELMGIQRNAFYRMICGGYSGTKKWTIIKTEERDETEMNKLTIIGNLTRAPELRTTTSGVSVCSFSIAVNRKRTANNPEPEADFFTVTAWRELGEICAKYLDKGSKVCVIGPVSVRQWESNGKHGASLEVAADDVEFLSSRQ